MKRLTLLLLLVAACSPPPTHTEVSFMVFGDASERSAYQQLVDAFAERRPDIRVLLLHVPGQSDYRKRLGIDFAAGTPADIVLINYRRYAGFAARGALEPLGPYLARSSIVHEADFYPQTLAPFRRDGQLMCIPQNLSSLVVYYNEALFDAAGVPYPQPGWAWNDMLRMAQALTRDTNGDGQIDQYGIGTEASLFRVAPFIWQNGGEPAGNPAAPPRLGLDPPAGRAAWWWFVELQTRHHVAPDAAAEAAESSESRFLNGRLAMFLNSRRGVPTYRTITGFGWNVAPLPVGHQAAGILHADAYCMPAVSRVKDAAWAFIEFANSAEGQAIVARSGRTVPSLRSVAESAAFLDPAARPAAGHVFLDGIAELRAVPVLPQWVDIEEIAGAEIERAFYGQAAIDEAIRTAIERTTPYFAE